MLIFSPKKNYAHLMWGRHFFLDR